jgi:hypothetical protein
VLALQVVEIAIFVPFILIGLSRLAAYVLRKLEDHEEEYFVATLLILAVAGALAQTINLPGIVGAFLAGLAINVAAHAKPAKVFGRLRSSAWRNIGASPDYRYSIPPEERSVSAGVRNEALARVLFAISFANKQIGGGNEGISH